VVTSRSVLIYVDEVAQSIREVFRVLKPGGRLVLFEPINDFGRWRTDTFCGYDVTGIADLADKVRRAWDGAEMKTMLQLNERELVVTAEQAGFERIDATVELKLGPTSVLSPPWESAFSCRPNPLVSRLGDAIDAALTRDEAERFRAALRPLVEAGAARSRSATVLMLAVKGC
jgi:arsenite methyltransferase